MKGCLENALRVPWGVRGKNEAKPCFSNFLEKKQKKKFLFFPILPCFCPSFRQKQGEITLFALFLPCFCLILSTREEKGLERKKKKKAGLKERNDLQ